MTSLACRLRVSQKSNENATRAQVKVRLNRTRRQLGIILREFLGFGLSCAGCCTPLLEAPLGLTVVPRALGTCMYLAGGLEEGPVPFVVPPHWAPLKISCYAAVLWS